MVTFGDSVNGKGESTEPTGPTELATPPTASNMESLAESDSSSQPYDPHHPIGIIFGKTNAPNAFLMSSPSVQKNRETLPHPISVDFKRTQQFLFTYSAMQGSSFRCPGVSQGRNDRPLHKHPNFPHPLMTPNI